MCLFALELVGAEHNTIGEMTVKTVKKNKKQLTTPQKQHTNGRDFLLALLKHKQRFGKTIPILPFPPWDAGIYDELKPSSGIWVRSQSATPVNHCFLYSSLQATEFANLFKVKSPSAEFS